jgi:hypothetical protein
MTVDKTTDKQSECIFVGIFSPTKSKWNLK